MDEEEGLEEARLVERAKEDPEAFGVLYEKYVGKIYGYIYARVGNRGDAEDLTSRTFYRALRRLDSYEDRGWPFSTLLYRIAHNLVANFLRDQERHSMGYIEDFVRRRLGRSIIPLDRLAFSGDRVTSPETQVEEEEEQQANRKVVLRAVQRLRPSEQQLLVLKFVEEMSNVEIGQVLGCSVGAVKSRYYRILKGLREEFEVE